MPTQHLYLPQHLALAIALALGCVEVSMAQPAAGEIKAFETTAQMQARLDAFMTATGTERYDITKPQDSPDGVPLLRGDHDDLVVVSGRGKLMELVDGGGGANVLQLDTAKGDKLGVIKNIQDLQIKRSEWSNSESFGGRSLIEAKAKLINTGHIGSEVHVLGKFDNQGTVAGPIFVGEKAMFSGSGTVESLSVAGQLEVDPKRGAPSITKNLELSKSAKLIYGVNSEGDSATIKVRGTATLGNATLKISAAPGEYIDTRKHVVIEANKVEGTFAKIDSGLKFMKATVDYSNEKQVGLTYARNNVPLKEAATSKNGQNFAASVEEPQPLKPPASVLSAAPTVVQAPAVKPKIEAPANTPSKQPKITSASPKTTAQSQAAKSVEKNHTATPTPPGTDMRAATDASQSKIVPPT
ncbi:autotransporter outer membrane beta-barrel domain-containing protein, partial [Pseudomonas brassicacearum subsp. neoaurantiaca]|nr:autotransporter outer membrane beta-barrel domain-containing protein [Pseudomonas brassicacearum subsp. neoaurantiaca]